MNLSKLKKTCSLTLVFLIIFVGFSFAQNVKVNGYMSDIFNRILMGVSVKSVDAPTEVFTDSLGYYEITVPQKSKLIFSGPGFATQKVSVKGKTSIDVSLNFDLEKNNANKEAESSKKTQTSSSVNQKLIQGNKELGMDQLLKTIPGVQVVFVGPEMKVIVRGIKSLNSDSYALIVLNGFVYNGSLSDLNRNDVESIEVLKDPTALSAWGSRGANGVILISTKTAAKQ